MPSSEKNSRTLRRARRLGVLLGIVAGGCAASVFPVDYDGAASATSRDGSTVTGGDASTTVTSASCGPGRTRAQLFGQPCSPVGAHCLSGACEQLECRTGISDAGPIWHGVVCNGPLAPPSLHCVT